MKLNFNLAFGLCQIFHLIVDPNKNSIFSQMKSSELVNISGDEKNLSILNKWKLKAPAEKSFNGQKQYKSKLKCTQLPLGLATAPHLSTPSRSDKEYTPTGRWLKWEWEPQRWESNGGNGESEVAFLHFCLRFVPQFTHNCNKLTKWVLGHWIYCSPSPELQRSIAPESWTFGRNCSTRLFSLLTYLFLLGLLSRAHW